MKRPPYLFTTALATAAMIGPRAGTNKSLQGLVWVKQPRRKFKNSPALLRQVPADALTVTDWYKQDVYDPNNNKIGQVTDVLLDKSGKITSLIIGVGGFLGAGEKDVAVPFDAVRVTNKNNKKFTLVLNTTKDDLKSAPGFKYDKDTTTWVPDSK